MRLNLPIKHKGNSVLLIYENKKVILRISGIDHLFIVNHRLLYILIFLLLLTFTYQIFAPTSSTNQTVIQLNGKNYGNDAIGYFIDYFEEVNNTTLNTSFQDDFLIKKQMLISKYIIKNRVARLGELSDSDLLLLNREISNLYLQIILPNVAKEKHVLKYFSDTTDLHKIETALMEQVKYNLPASIKLAQSALETAYGRKVIHNNYFGIKDKSKTSEKTIRTTEYYTLSELKHNQHKILSQEKVLKNGVTLYKCLIEDKFFEYASPWESFRAHSLFLKNQKRYASLFVEGKNYEAWADKIGSTKYGGVGYATSPIYGELLKKIIKRYKLNLLDY